MSPGFVSARPRLFVVIALLLSAGLFAGAAVALVSVRDDNGPSNVAGPSPSATPSPTPSETPAPTPTPSPSPSPSPSATTKPSATASASPRASASASTKPGNVRTYAYPKPTRGYDSLYFFNVMSTPDQNGATGTTLTIDARDGDGDVTFGGLTWGDGSSVAAEAVPSHCPAYPSPTAAPGPYQPKPTTRKVTFHHKYAGLGPYTIWVTMKSGNNSCRPNGPGPESQRISIGVKFNAAPTPEATP